MSKKILVVLLVISLLVTVAACTKMTGQMMHWKMNQRPLVLPVFN